MATFSDRLRELRQNYGLSQQKLADEIGTISKSSINMYERGAREPSLETMEAFADFFNVDLAYLFGRSDIPNRAASVIKSEEQTASRIVLSSREVRLVIAYRSHPEMQGAVNRLLDIAPEAAEIPKQA